MKFRCRWTAEAAVPAWTHARRLLVLQYLIDDDFAAFIYRDDFVDGGIAAQGDVDDVVAGIENKVNRRVLIQHVLVDGHLGSLGLGFDADRAHALRFFAAEELVHLADGFDVVDIAERLESGREIGGLAQGELSTGGLVDVTRLAHQYDVLALVHRDLGGSELAGVLAVNVDVGARGTARDGKRRRLLREMAGDKSFAAGDHVDSSRIRGIASFADGDGMSAGG